MWEDLILSWLFYLVQESSSLTAFPHNDWWRRLKYTDVYLQLARTAAEIIHTEDMSPRQENQWYGTVAYNSACVSCVWILCLWLNNEKETLQSQTQHFIVTKLLQPLATTGAYYTTLINTLKTTTHLPKFRENIEAAKTLIIREKDNVRAYLLMFSLLLSTKTQVCDSSPLPKTHFLFLYPNLFLQVWRVAHSVTIFTVRPSRTPH